MNYVFRLAILLLPLMLLPATGCGWLHPAPKPLERAAANVSVGGLAAGGMTRAEVAELLIPLSQGQNLAPQDAFFDADSDRIITEKPGQLLDIPRTVDLVMAAPPEASVTPLFRSIAAGITAADLAQAEGLGSSTTRILDQTPSRVHNIRLASGIINNAVLEPGYEFSFNRRLGEPTADRGFLPATVFAEGGRLEQETGGGVCQVSSTLYSAALAARLTITERHPHSRPVAYIPQGQDATTYTDKDLRFINSTGRRVILRSRLKENSLSVDIMGLPEPLRRSATREVAR